MAFKYFSIADAPIQSIPFITNLEGNKHISDRSLTHTLFTVQTKVSKESDPSATDAIQINFSSKFPMAWVHCSETNGSPDIRAFIIGYHGAALQSATKILTPTVRELSSDLCVHFNFKWSINQSSGHEKIKLEKGKLDLYFLAEAAQASEIIINSINSTGKDSRHEIPR